MSQHKLQIGDGFTLPLEAVTQTFAILAKRGVGKTYTASVLAEEMLKAGQQIIALDPVGAMWGLRSHFPVVVLGGERGDVRLEESAGETVATAIVENRFSAVLDLSLFRKGASHRFVTAFLETLFRLNRDAVHLFVDEADDIAPQKPFGDEAKMLGAIEDVVKRGRKRGIGCTLITQRPADLAKQVLTQCEILVSLRIVHPRDINAIKEWVAVHGDPETARSMIAGLPSLPVGEAWFWAPGWGDIFRQVKIRKRITFDSGATPKPGEKPKAPPKLAAVDLEKLGKQIQSAVESSKANDPAALKAKIAKLEKDLAAKPAAAPAKVERVEVPVLTEAEKKLLWGVRDRLSQFRETAEMVAKACTLISKAAAPASAPKPGVAPTHIPANNLGNKTHKVLQTPSQIANRESMLRNEREHHGAGVLGKAPRMILTALVQHGASTKSKVAILAGYAVSGGGFNNALGSLRGAGYLGGRGDLLEVTEAGAAALGPVQPLPTGQDLVDQWKRDLPKAESLILDCLCRRYPEEMTKEEVAAAVGYEASGGGFNNALGKLRTLELIEGRGSIKASASLFA